MDTGKATRATALFLSPIALLMAFVIAIPVLLSDEDCGMATATGPTSDAISVMSWNVCGSSCGSWATRSRHVMSEVGKHAPDIVSVQEGTWGKRKRPYTFNGFKRIGYATENNEAPFIGRYIFYNPGKFSALGGGSFSLGGTHGMSWTKLKTKADGVTFVVVDVHLTYPKGANAERASQMRRGLSKLASITRSTPTIWAGDFNSNASRSDDAPARIMKATGRVDSVDVATQKHNETVNSARDRKTRAKVERHGNQTDHIYVDKTIKVTAWDQVVNAKDGHYLPPFASDHNPILAVVGIPSGAAEPSATPTADASPAAADTSQTAPGKVGNYSAEQTKNAAIIAQVGKKLGVPERGRVIAIMTALGESGLRTLNYGDAAGPDSRGLFQQRNSWGTLAERMDPAKSAELFYRALLRVDGWQQLQPTQAAHRVQRNADPGHYSRWWDDAVTIYAAVSGTNLNVSTDLAPECVGDDINQAGYFSGADCDFAAYKNPRTCKEALAAAAKIATTSACRSDLPGGNWRRWCLAFVAKAYGHQFAGYPTARAMYEDMKSRGLIHHTKKIPAGSLVFFDSSDPADHVALAAGNGEAFSNDYIRSGCIDLTPMSKFGGAGKYLGWSPPAFAA